MSGHDMSPNAGFSGSPGYSAPDLMRYDSKTECVLIGTKEEPAAIIIPRAMVLKMISMIADAEQEQER